MPFVNNMKYSKTEIIRKLLKRDNNFLLEVLKSKGISIPKSVLFGENYDKEECKKMIHDNGFSGFYKYFKEKRRSLDLEDLKKCLDDNSVNSLEDKLMNNSNTKKIAEAPFSLSKEAVQNKVEKMKQIEAQLIFLSITNKNSVNEFAILDILRKNKNPGIQQFCLIKFKKETIRDFILSNICDLKPCILFLKSIRSKLPDTLVSVWFENDLQYDIILEHIRVCKGNEHSVIQSVKNSFRRELFLKLMEIPYYRWLFCNNIVDEEYCQLIRQYVDRADMEYYYRHTAYPSMVSSTRFHVYDHDSCGFFDDIGDYSKFRMNIKGASNYIKNNGFNFIIDKFVINEISMILEFTVKYLQENEDFNELSVFYSEVVKNTESCSVTDLIFSELKKFKILKNFILLFKQPKDRVLFNLVSGNYQIKFEDALSYVGMGYDDELLKYFSSYLSQGDEEANTRRAVELLQNANEWNSYLVISVFREQSSLLTNSSLFMHFTSFLQNFSILKYKQSKIECIKRSLIEIFSKIFQFCDMELFYALPHEFKRIYLCKHPSLITQFMDSIDPQVCTVEQGSLLYATRDKDLVREYSVPHEYNSNYAMALYNEFVVDETNLVDSLYAIALIRKKDFNILFVKYFEKLFEIVLCKLKKEDFDFFNSDLDPVVSTLSELESAITVKYCNGTATDEPPREVALMRLGFSNKYSIFILFGTVMDLLAGRVQFSHSQLAFARVILLSILDPSLLVQDHVLKYINTVIPLVSNTNYLVCRLAKKSINRIKLESPEIQLLLPDIISALTDNSKDSFEFFLEKFQSIFFNNYLCFNSLNFILQLLFKYLYISPKESFFILNRISNVIKEKDLSSISSLIFRSLSNFVVNSNFYNKEALEVCSQYCLFAKHSDFSELINNLRNERICDFVVGVLKIKKDSILSHKIITSGTDIGTDSAPFFASFSELMEFEAVLPAFLPQIKLLFKSTKMETRNFGARALKNSIKFHLYCDDITNFLIDCLVNMDFQTRLCALDILGCVPAALPVIFILKFDSHSLVRKKAIELWKSAVSNTNKILKSIYSYILDFVPLAYSSPSFLSSLQDSITEMATKYCANLENYLNESDDVQINEFILLRALGVGKMTDCAFRFLDTHFSVDIFIVLFHKSSSSFTLDYLNSFPIQFLLDVASKDECISHYLFTLLDDTIFLQYLSIQKKLEILRDASLSPNIIFLLETVSPCEEIERALLRLNPSFSLHYLNNCSVTDSPFLLKIWKYVFESCNGLDHLVTIRNLKYVKMCRFDRIDNKIGLLKLLIRFDDRVCFDRVVELVMEYKDILVFDLTDSFIYELLGYLLRHYISYNKKADAFGPISYLYHSYKDKIGYFRNIIEASVL